MRRLSGSSPLYPILSNLSRRLWLACSRDCWLQRWDPNDGGTEMEMPWALSLLFCSLSEFVASRYDTRSYTPHTQAELARAHEQREAAEVEAARKGAALAESLREVEVTSKALAAKETAIAAAQDDAARRAAQVC